MSVAIKYCEYNGVTYAIIYLDTASVTNINRAKAKVSITGHVWKNTTTALGSSNFAVFAGKGSYSGSPRVFYDTTVDSTTMTRTIFSFSLEIEYDRTGLSWDYYIDILFNCAYANYTSNHLLYDDLSIPAADAPLPPLSLSVSKSGSSTAALSWTNQTDASRTGILIEQRTNGGSWSIVKTVSASATSASVTTLSTDNAYEYRIRSKNSYRFSSYATSSTVIYTTPRNVSNVTLGRSDTSGNISVKIGSSSNIATSVIWRAGTSSNPESYVASGSSSNLAAFIAVTGISDNTCYIHFKYTRGSLCSSSWTTASIVVASKPNVPNVSCSGLIDKTETQSVRLSFAHSPTDGSAQTGSKVRWSLDNGTWTETADLGTATGWTLDASSIPVGSKIYLSAMTKGASATWSDWSPSVTCMVYAKPSMSLTAPPETVTAMPVECTAVGTDMLDAGTGCRIASATVTLLDSDGTTMFSEGMTISMSGESFTLSASLGPNEFIPENGETYTIIVFATSTSSLSAAATAAFTVDWTLPKTATVYVTPDSDTGYVSLFVSEDSGATGEAIRDLDIIRVANGKRVTVAKAVQPGFSMTDKYAPLNTAYAYEVATYAASGAMASTETACIIETDRWFAYWGANIAYAIWNPEDTLSFGRPEKTRVRYVGRTYPVSYDSSALSEEHSPSFLLVERARAKAFRTLMEDGGRGVYKSCRGDVFHADFDLDLSPADTERGYWGSISVKVTRIEGDDL